MATVRVIPLGGAGEIGKNCTVLEQGEDLIVVDVGLSFPHEEQYGVDIVVPDFSYLIENQHRIKGVFLTHAHEDHVGALSYLLREVDVPLYCTKLVRALVKMKLDERMRGFEPKIREVQPGDTVEVGSLKVEFVRVTHSIPETCALAIHTVHGVVLFTADFKFDFAPVDRAQTDLHRLIELGEEGVVLLMSDSTNVDRPGWGPSESEATQGLRSVFAAAPGRILVTMFSSNIHRMQQVVNCAHALGKKVAVAGRRMQQVFEIARNLEYAHIPRGTLIPIEDVGKYSASELVILLTGSQGEPMAALSQMSRAEYRWLKVAKGDTIVYSARPIPGNEGVIWRTINKLVQLGANVVTEAVAPIHVSGHAYRDEIKTMVNLTKPFYIAPVHGEPRHQKIFRELAQQMGHADHRIFTLANGDVLEIEDERAGVNGTVTAGEILIDQHGDVEVTLDVLNQRTRLAHDGILIVTVTVNAHDGTLGAPPKVQARGFSGGEELVEDIDDAIEEELVKLSSFELKETDYVRSVVTDTVRRMLNKDSRQRPEVVINVVPVKS
ncbi:MAG: ribonuclease J [Fimbriimonadaceae bacterium]|nr:ribonuclease J [Fimbriimonadaceae bacterium]